jgi:LysM repeat protein
MTTSCNKFYLVVSGDTCYGITAKYGITLPFFYTWNPAVGTSCLSLYTGNYVCVGVVG